MTITLLTPSKKRFSWLRLLAWIFGSLLVLLVVAYFVGTSAAFLKGVILPKVGKAVNAEITVSDATISPFSQVILKDLKVKTTGSEPLVSASEVRLRYSLMAIIRGNIQVEEVTLVSPTIVLVKNADGTSNLDPLLKSQPTTATKTTTSTTTKSSAPLQIDIKKIALTDATIRNETLYAGGQKDVAEISKVNVSVENVKNGQTGKLAISASVAVNNNPPAGVAGALAATINGGYDFALSAALLPESVKGNVRLEVTQASGQFAQANAFAADLGCDLTATEIKQVGLQFKQSGHSLGQVLVSGPLDLQKLEGHLTIVVAGIDKQVLNLAAPGMDFGATTINSTNDLVLARAGAQITAKGGLNLQNLQVTRAGQSTPVLGLTVGYEVAVDRTANSVNLNAFTLNGTEAGKPVLTGGLSSPMTLNLSGTGAAAGDSKLNLTVNHLNLAEWQSFLQDTSLAGDVSVALSVLSQQGGKQNTIDLNSQLNHLAAGAGKVQVTSLNFQTTLKHSTPDFKQNTVAGSLVLTNVTAQLGGTSLTNFGTAIDLDVVVGQTQVQLNKLAGQLTMGGHAGGAFELGATVTLSNQAAQVTAKLTDINQSLLRPFLEPALAGKKLASVAINASLAAQYDPQAASTVTGGLAITNLVLTDPTQSQPATPFSVAFQINGGLNRQVVDLKSFSVALTPTERGTNVIQLSGQVDLSQTNVAGNLKLTATTIDLTGFYDLLVPTNPAAASAVHPTAATKPTATTPTTPTASNANSDQEPAALHFPVRNFTFGVDIQHLYLHEVHIAGLSGTVKLDDSHLVLNPFQLTLNGAPISASVDADAGVPGFKYDVSFNAAAVPLAPLVNSFQPSQKGIVGGHFSALAKITGAGVTGASLKKNLAGQFDFGSTNLNLAATNMPTKTLKVLVGAIAEIPGLVQNAGGVGGGLLKGALGLGSSTNVDLNKSAVDSIVATGTIGAGKITVEKLLIQSPAFQAHAPVTITLDPVLTNSILNVPVSVALERSVASACYLAGNAPATDTYVQLPAFLTMQGTLGNPQKHIESAALVKLALQGVAASGAVKGTGGQVLQGVNALLGGSSSTNSTGATNSSPANNLLRGFLK